MKLKTLRDHYYTPDNGLTWIPKKEFKTRDDIIKEKFFPNKWHSYRCSHCNHFHISKVIKGRAISNVS